MQETLNELMPWGLTLAQTLVILGGVFMLILAWSILQMILKIGKLAFRMGLLVVAVGGACVALLLLVYNFA